jgi:hypothetical protein
MNLHRRTWLLFSLAIALLLFSLVIAKTASDPSASAPHPTIASTADPAPPPPPDRDRAAPNKVQIAILLDTSSSMDGLIAQAKTQLWRIVNEFSGARRGGRAPLVEIALYEYGKSTLASGEGFIRMILPFTTDLDRVSEELFALNTIGGEEYCGKVIQAATQSLAWSPRADDLKLIFIAGNEPFTQGDVDYRRSVRAAAEKGIVTNTIFCGSVAEGAASGWQDGARIGGGRYLSIDQDRPVAVIDAPQDAEIAKLGTELNATYLPFGVLGEASAVRQAAQDQNAVSSGLGNFVQRSLSKASSNYQNPSWDLVDAWRTNRVSSGEIEKMEARALPSAMQAMAPAERRAYVERHAAHRAELQRRIAELDLARKKFVADAAAQKAQASAPDTLDGAVLAAVHEQAARAGYHFQ